ncbi:protein phosphatase 2C domain-containing protein [Longispora urticae]
MTRQDERGPRQPGVIHRLVDGVWSIVPRVWSVLRAPAEDGEARDDDRREPVGPRGRTTRDRSHDGYGQRGDLGGDPDRERGYTHRDGHRGGYTQGAPYPRPDRDRDGGKRRDRPHDDRDHRPGRVGRVDGFREPPARGSAPAPRVEQFPDTGRSPGRPGPWGDGQPVRPGHQGGQPPGPAVSPGPGPDAPRPRPSRNLDPPVLGEESPLARAAWRLPLEPSQPGISADEGLLGDVTVRAASVVGPGHRHSEATKPRQDAYRIGRTEDGRYLIAAVADGMSDSARADLGATVAATTAVSYLRTRLAQVDHLSELDPDEVFTYVAGAMVQQAKARHLSEGDIRTTLVVAVVPATAGRDGGRVVWLAAVGDSAVWLRQGDEWELAAGDAKSTDGDNSVACYLPHRPSGADHVVATFAVGSVLALLTDGVADAFHKFPGAERYFAERWSRPVPATAVLIDVNYEARTAQDDRTAVVLWLGERPVLAKEPPR